MSQIKQNVKRKTSKAKKMTTAKKSSNKSVVKNKKTTSKKPAVKKAPKKKSSVAKKKSSKPAKKKVSVSRNVKPTIHRSEYISPMTSLPLDKEDFFPNSEIDLNELPSLADELDVPMPTQEPQALGIDMVASRMSFYIGIFFGAIVLHTLMISVLAVMSV